MHIFTAIIFYINSFYINNLIFINLPGTLIVFDFLTNQIQMNWHELHVLQKGLQKLIAWTKML